MIRGGSVLWVLGYTMILFVLVMGELSRAYCVDCLREDALTRQLVVVCESGIIAMVPSSGMARRGCLIRIEDCFVVTR